MSLVPLHTRAITFRLRWSRPGEVLVEARLMDLRKRSIVPLGASLRGPGLVHDMSTRVCVDLERLVITAVDPEMRAFPYVASTHTGGESCSGRMTDVQSLVGTHLTDSYTDEVISLLGGPRGCFHIFTLLRLSGPAVMAGLRDEYVRRRLAEDNRPAAGEVLWSRCVTVDSFKGEGLALQLHGTLTDTFQRGGPPERGKSSEELVHGVEVMADLSTGLPAMTVDRISGRRRQLLPGFGDYAAWEPLPALEKLRQVSVKKGFTSRVKEVLDDPAGLRPESHLIFVMAPVVMQSLPGLLEEMDVRTGGGGGRVATGTALNSCHMWRADGPLDQMTQPVKRGT